MSADSSLPLLEIINLSKTFNDNPVLYNFSLALERGSFTALVGPSGCGKSTLFALLTGLITPDAGRIIWNGTQTSQVTRMAAVMQQKDLLLPWLTLRENVILPLKIAGQNTAQSEKQVMGYLEQLGLANALDRLPSELSGGMRQRGALARTLTLNRELLLLDEPLSALDSITRQSLWKMLADLRSLWGKTVLMITHDVEEALALANRIVVLTSSPMKIVRSINLVDSPLPRKFNGGQCMELREEIMDLLRSKCMQTEQVHPSHVAEKQGDENYDSS